MKLLSLIVLLVLVTTTSYAKIYKWVDESGSIHFSDKPSSEEAQEVDIKSTGIKMHKTDEDLKREKTEEVQNKKAIIKSPIEKPKVLEKEKIITEADYKITSGVGKLGSDAVSITGRISSGPKCKNMTVTATAKSDNGLSGTITDQVRKSNSYGSTVFEGATKISGSAEDFGFWTVESVKIRCND